jgi:hypothetical protein
MSKRWTSALIFSVGVGVLWAIASVGTLSATEPIQVKTISGVVRAYEFNGDVVSSVYVVDQEDNKFLVLSEGRGKKLLNHVGATVSIKGSLEPARDPAFSQAIKVRRFTVTDESSEEEMDSET